MNYTKRKFISMLCILVMTVSMLTGCGNSSSNGDETESTDYSNQTITVQVESVDGTDVTAVIGEITEESAGGDSADGETPEMPEASDGEAPSGEAPSDMPANDGTDSATEGADGEAPEAPAATEGADGEAPEAPAATEGADGEAPAAAEGADGEAPEKPDGDAMQGGGAASKTFTASEETITFSIADVTDITVEYQQGSTEGTTDDIVANAVLEVTFGDNQAVTSITVKNLQSGTGFGGSSEVTNGTAANTIDEDTSETGSTYTSSGDDENALRVDGATATLDGITVEKTGGESSNTEDGDFYGQNAGLLALNGATVNITNAIVNTDAVNGNGVFSYGEGTTVNISDSTIRTTQNNSGGIQTTGGGTTNATDLDVETQGTSSAAIRSDRGGGTVNVSGGTYTTNGTGSPAIYCTADINVSGATLTANASEGVVVEGENSVSLENCTVTGNMQGTYGDDSSQNIQNIMIYQSMSGDAEVGNASFSATGGSITAQAGDMIYVTNTSCTITLSEVVLTLANDTLLNIAGNDGEKGWGTVGSNGGNVTFVNDAQDLTGNILVDDISTLDMTLSNGSTYEGAINPDGEAGEVNLTVDSSSSWTLTADSYVTSFDGSIDNINTNGFTLYINGVAATK